MLRHTANRAWPASLSTGARALTVRGEDAAAPEWSRRFLGLVDLDLFPDVVERVGDLPADVDRPRLVTSEELGIVAMDPVADCLHIALSALRCVSIVTVILGTHQGVVAIKPCIALELVRDHGRLRVTVGGQKLLRLPGGVEDRPVKALDDLACGREGLQQTVGPRPRLAHEAGRRCGSVRLLREDPRAV